jgi:hypothetical protein
MAADADPTTWQWIANAATAAVVAVGGFMFKGFNDRVKALEDKELISVDFLDDRLRELAEQRASDMDERRWMHNQNQLKLDSLTARVDRILERD